MGVGGGCMCVVVYGVEHVCRVGVGCVCMCVGVGVCVWEGYVGVGEWVYVCGGVWGGVCVWGGCGVCV